MQTIRNKVGWGEAKAAQLANVVLPQCTDDFPPVAGQSHRHEQLKQLADIAGRCVWSNVKWLVAAFIVQTQWSGKSARPSCAQKGQKGSAKCAVVDGASISRARGRLGGNLNV